MNVNITDHQLKILILIVLKSAGSPIPEITLTDILGLCDINCFNIQQCISELTENGYIIRLEDEKRYFTKISELGAGIADTLRQDVPYSLRELAASVTATQISNLSNNLAYNSKIEKCNLSEGLPYNVTFSINDGGYPLLHLCIYTPTEFQAEIISNNFLKSPNELYKNILNLLTKSNLEQTEDSLNYEK